MSAGPSGGGLGRGGVEADGFEAAGLEAGVSGGVEIEHGQPAPSGSEGSGFEVRVDPLTGQEVVIVAGRQHRPNLPAAGRCPFCVGGTEAPEPYDVRWFVNRWPPMPASRCEVVLHSPDHDASWSTLGPDRATRVVDVWAERTAALGGRHDVAYVLVFENRGAEVGATIAHPHGQIYAFGEVPPVPAAELARAAAAGCALCAPPAPERLVAAAEGWRAEVPLAPAWPYGLVVAPDDHVGDLPSCSAAQRHGLAVILVDAVGRLDRWFGAPAPYMCWVHQRPTDGGSWPAAHLHVHLAPLWRAPGVARFVAAGELGSGVMFDPVTPEQAADDLRSAAPGGAPG